MSFVARLGGGRSETEEQAVARNLTAVLNARKGYAEAVEIFGLGDYDGVLPTKPLLQTLMREMLENVKAFEPRAKKPELSFLARESSLFATFRLRCEIDDQPAAFKIRMQTILRYVTVEPIPPSQAEGGGT